MSRLSRCVFDNLSGFFGINEKAEDCLSCGEKREKGEKLCRKCRSQIVPISGDICLKCGRYMKWRKKDNGDGTAGESLFCPSCTEEKNYYSIVISCYEYSGLCKELLHRLKYMNEPELAEVFGESMANAIGKALFEGAGFLFDKEVDRRLKNTILVPVPISEDKMRSRGYNQALCLAEIIGRVAGLKVINALDRKRETIVQHKLTKTQRNLNIMGAFSLNLEYNIFEKHIILVDDIFTTGSTANECAKALKAGGCRDITVITAAGGGKKNL